MVLNKNNSLYLRIQYINFSKKLIESFISKRIKKGNKNRSFSSFFKLLRLLQVFGKISNNLNYFFEKNGILVFLSSLFRMWLLPFNLKNQMFIKKKRRFSKKPNQIQLFLKIERQICNFISFIFKNIQKFKINNEFNVIKVILDLYTKRSYLTNILHGDKLKLLAFENKISSVREVDKLKFNYHVQTALFLNMCYFKLNNFLVDLDFFIAAKMYNYFNFYAKWFKLNFRFIKRRIFIMIKSFRRYFKRIKYNKRMGSRVKWLNVSLINKRFTAVYLPKLYFIKGFKHGLSKHIFQSRYELHLQRKIFCKNKKTKRWRSKKKFYLKKKFLFNLKKNFRINYKRDFFFFFFKFRKLRKKLRYSKRKYGVIHKFSFFESNYFLFFNFFFYNKYTMVVRENYFFKRYNFIVRLPQLQNFFKFIGKSQFNFFLSHRLCLYFSKVYSKRFICYFLKKQKYLLLQIKMYLIKVKLSRNATKKKKLKRKKRSKFINRCNSNPKSMTKRITKTKKLMIDV